MTFAVVVPSALALTTVSAVGAAWIGLQEAGDPDHSRIEDLREFEKSWSKRTE